ncbi:FAD-dependent monooxygenase [Nocardia arthritidis]|uniref:FAD-dependent oxidoreductase n=1 Tax=Nocardia arthritidis TaxID=228602 RepID=A0A6G9YA62_9NOCA|nr:FAD-dependent monooxygenase [Nocardia arthritidis]QIS10155.1 FAD-dependent oxidoreductase [Nocardia arthritidis]
MYSKTVLISGAGVAGQALAYWLHRYGYTPTVIERAPRHYGTGFDVDVRGPALDVLDRMALLEQVRAHQTPRRDTVLLDGDGNQVDVLPPEIFAGDVEIHNRDLLRILYSATRNEVRYLFGNSITGLLRRDDGVRVSFERGEPEDFDLVVGADGIHSTVREMVFGAESNFIHHLGIAFGAFTTRDYLTLGNRGMLYRAPGISVGVNGRSDLGELHVVVSFAADALDPGRYDIEQRKKIVADQCAGLGWETPRLIAAMRDAPDFFFGTISQIRMDRWAQGRVVLVGDAAYCAAPTSGRGTSQALIGAYILAGELATARDHTEAFAEYERQLRGYVAGNQRIGRRTARWFLEPDADAEHDAADTPVAVNDYLS